MEREAEGALTKRQRDWREHLARCTREGLTLKAYAAREGLKVSSLYGWRKKLKAQRRGDTTAVAFAEARVAPPPPVGLAGCRLHFPGGCVLEWVGEVDVAALGRLVRAWEAGR